MAILIENMEMPTEGYIDVRIKCNGTASFAIAKNPYFKVVEAVSVPEPHGRLIDADALLKEAEVPASLFPFGWEERFEVKTHAVALGDVIDAPTVIPASEEG